MRQQVFSHYQRLAREGKVDPIRCIDLGHMAPLVPAYDFDKDQPYLYCQECTYVVHPGQNLYYKLIDTINAVDPYPEFPNA